MNVKKIRLLSLVALLLCGVANARELRTPWSFSTIPYFHYPICRPVDCETRWNFDTWAGALHRESNTAFTDDHGTKTDESLAGIVFGKDSFTGLEAFAPGTVAPNNPLLRISTLSPRYDYRENSAYFGFIVERGFGCDRTWRGGMRATIPFRSIKVELECCDFEETVDDFCCRQHERINSLDPSLSDPIQTVFNCYAYRLDFLSSLFMTQAGVADNERLVKFNDPIEINEINVTDPNDNPIHVIQRDNGTKPTGAFCEMIITVTNDLPFVGAGGSGPGNNQRARFQQGIDYSPLGNDLEAQKKLWVVPTAAVNTGNPSGNQVELVQDARVIGTKIQDLTDKINGTVVDFFNSNGVSFDTQHTVGAGNLDVEFYLNRERCNHFGEVFFGFRFPTGVKAKDPGKIMSIFTTGNNNHYEIKLGGLWSYQPRTWFFFKLDAAYSHVIGRTEKVAAPFKGAQVKNIGPTIDASVSWDYFTGHADFTFMVPCNPRVGFTFGYEIYAKSKDKISLDQTTATDFLGNVRLLDVDVLRLRTDVVSHKVRTEMFHQGDYWEIWGGWTHVFAGRNAPRESDWHLGFAAYF